MPLNTRCGRFLRLCEQVCHFCLGCWVRKLTFHCCGFKSICCDFIFFSPLTAEAERWISFLDSNDLPCSILLIRYCVRWVMWSRRKCHLVNVTVFEGGLERYFLSLMGLQEMFFLRTGRILLKYLNWIFFFCRIGWKITMQMPTFVFKRDINWESQCNILLAFIPHWELLEGVLQGTWILLCFFLLSYSRSHLRKTRFSLPHGERFETMTA